MFVVLMEGTSKEFATVGEVMDATIGKEATSYEVYFHKEPVLQFRDVAISYGFRLRYAVGQLHIHTLKGSYLYSSDHPNLIAYARKHGVTPLLYSVVADYYANELAQYNLGTH